MTHTPDETAQAISDLGRLFQELERLQAVNADLLAALKADVTDLRDFIDEHGEFPFSIDAAKGMIRRGDAAIAKTERD